MSIKVTVSLVLPHWWGADDAFAERGEDAIKELILEDIGAFMLDDAAQWDVTQVGTKVGAATAVSEPCFT